MGDGNRSYFSTSNVTENGRFPEHSLKGIHMPLKAGYIEGIFDNTSENEGENDTLEGKRITSSSNAAHFSPHPPEIPKDSPQRSPRRLKARSPKRSERPLLRRNSKESSSDDEKIGYHIEIPVKMTINGSKLPPITRKESDVDDPSVPVPVPFGDGIGNEENISVVKNLKRNPLVPNLKPLSPIKDQKKLVENFKSKQSLERERQHEKNRINKGPVKPLQPSEGVSSLALNKKTRGRDDPLTMDHDSEEDTLTSVSSEGSSSLEETDSDNESNHAKGDNGLKMKYYPQPPSMPPSIHRHHTSLSLTSVRDNAESIGRHSDTEAVRRERKEKRRSTKELWDKARVETLLPRVPASKARDRNSNFVNEELEKYLPENKLMVFVGTWNMHSEKQLPVFVDDFLLPECSTFMQDLYVIGTQESTPSRKEWEIKLQEALGPSHVMIYSCAFGVLHVAMFLRRELVWFCSAVEQATVATRPGHMIKTKGAIGLTLSIFGTSFLFINSHFTAHEPKWKERIEDYRLIRRTLSLPLNCTETATKNTDVTSRFHQVFWFGDFNFRVEEHQGVVEKFLRQCEEDEDPSYDELVAKDQMKKSMNKDGCVLFEHFKEHDIEFAPTYKFEINPDDPDNYSRSRVPSWTDRIVYRCQEENDVKPLHYDSCPTLINSDHKPVYGIFEATIKPIKDRVTFTGVQFIRDVYIEANRRRATPLRNQNQTSVCTIL